MGSQNEDRINVSMPEDLKRQIRVEAAKRDMSMSQLVRKVLREELLEDPEGNPTLAATA